MNSRKFIENRTLYRGRIRLSYTKLQMIVIVDFNGSPRRNAFLKRKLK